MRQYRVRLEAALVGMGVTGFAAAQIGYVVSNWSIPQPVRVTVCVLAGFQLALGFAVCVGEVETS